jgi:hypothetical protein
MVFSLMAHSFRVAQISIPLLHGFDVLTRPHKEAVNPPSKSATRQGRCLSTIPRLFLHDCAKERYVSQGPRIKPPSQPPKSLKQGKYMRNLKSLVQALTFLITVLLRSQIAQSQPSGRELGLPSVRPGDIILIDLGCYACRIISATTNSLFNHSGLVIETTDDGQVYVAQSLSKTEKIPLADFLSQAKRQSAIMVRRPRELDEIYRLSRRQFDALALQLARVFDAEFEGLPFDDAFLWDNNNSQGEELLYCSEMIQKALNRILIRDLAPAPMDFSTHMDFWQRYFHGQVPQGLPGNSPASFERESLLMTVLEKGQR